MTLVQKALVTGSHPIAQVEPRIEPVPYGLRRYFHMGLFDRSSTNNPDVRHSWREVQALEAGKAYVLQVTSDPDSDQRTSEDSVTMYSDIKLFLFCINPTVAINEQSHLVMRNDADQIPYDFLVQVQQDYPGDRVEFQLCWQRVGRLGSPICASRLVLKGNGRAPGSPFPIQILGLDYKLSEKSRVLYVTPQPSSLMHIHCVWNQEVELEMENIVNPAVSPARSMQPRHELPPQDIIDQAKAKSNDIEPKLERWLKNNLRKYGSEFCLVVHDGSVESDMAWELVFVNIDPNDLQIPDLDLYGEVPIGALCTVVRWIPGLRWHETYLYPDEARAIKGKVMYYLDHAGVANSGIEQNLLKKFSSEAHNSIRNLIDQQLYSDIALVYLGCHGTPVDYGQVRTLILGPLFPHGEITVYNLASLPYLDPTSPRPLVIVNACYSAWTIEHERSRHGAPVAFLKTITKNFIGTIGPVDTQNAAQIATKLLENATSHEEGIRPAAILRDMRAEVVRQHINGGVNEWRVYLDTFMYVYYGNPYTRLHLLSADIGESGVSQ